MDSKASEMCYPRTSFTLPCDRVSVSESVTESYDGITAECSFTDGYGRVEVRALLCPMLCIVLCGSPHWQSLRGQSLRRKEIIPFLFPHKYLSLPWRLILVVTFQ